MTKSNKTTTLAEEDEIQLTSEDDSQEENK